jgi:hypothetical protein
MFRSLVDDPRVVFLALFGVVGAEEEVTVLAGAEWQRNDSLTRLHF